ncbi:MAG TPA: hypothetical protein VK196_13175 [Magnetospirillum sp.]|nr:hypothetical protein [Magnetospirillum sp.]
MFVFNRGISQHFVQRLNAEYERGGWWRALASDRDLFVAIRDGYLNVYWNGNSLLKLSLDGDRLAGEVHYKYLLRPDGAKPYVPVENGMAHIPDVANLFQADLSDVPALKRAAAPFAGDEKAGVHRIVLSNPNVLDVEIAFSVGPTGEDGPLARRIDFAAWRPTSQGAEVVFYEAKQFSNAELRASGDAPAPVVGQINGYQELLARHRTEVERSYRTVCGNLVALLGVHDRYAGAQDQMRQLATNDVPLKVDEAVRLVVFGFDSDQRDGAAWKPHREKLEKALPGRVLLKGEPKGFTKGISANS